MSDGRPRRQAALRAAMAGHGVDALLISGAPNIRYLTGFSGSAGYLVVTTQRTVLVTDFRYEAQGAAEVGSAAEVRIERASLWAGLRAVLASAQIETLGVDRARVTLADQDELRQAPGLSLVPLAGLVEPLRAAKDLDEVASIKAAADLASAALGATVDFIRPGRTELEVAALLESNLRQRGSEWHPFQTIVASGPRSALPHARSTGRTIEAGDLLVIDFGAELDGYCSDISRTFVVGARADDRQRTTYEVVRQAQARARSGLKAGLTGREGDSLARDVINRAGMGPAFGHSLGHGIGLEVHEAPRLSQTSEAPLPAGAVVTVEPGVYFEGWGGIRIEDDVVLLPDRAECLSDGMTDLVELV